MVKTAIVAVNEIITPLYLTAKFVKISYNITFDYDNGFAVNPSLLKLSELPITLINPYKEGYKFVGWTGTNGDNPELAVKITKAAGRSTVEFDGKVYSFSCTENDVFFVYKYLSV